MFKLFTASIFMLAGATLAYASDPGIFVSVSSKGTYLKTKKEDKKFPPTSRSITQLNLDPLDYMGISVKGAYSNRGPNFPPSLPDARRFLLAVFYSKANFLFPAIYGQQSNVQTSLPDVKQDFEVNQEIGATTIVRTPSINSNIAFSPWDSFFSDNEDPNRDFGVLVTYPNTPPERIKLRKGFMNSTRYDLVDTDEEVVDDYSLSQIKPSINSIGVKNYTLSQGVLFSDMYSPLVPVPYSQLRGNYKNTISPSYSVWNPALSKFNGRQNKHKGVDIFAPENTPVRAAIEGRGHRAYIKGYGNSYLIEFRLNNKTHWILYGHLNSFVANDNIIVRKGDIVALVGCAGNAGKEACGRNLLPDGGRTDHVHVGVYVGDLKEKSTIDPVKFLGLKLKYY